MSKVPRPFDPDALLSAPLMAILATSCAQGPRTTPVWYLWEDGALWMPGDATNSSVARLGEDTRATAETVDSDIAAGRLLHLGLRGEAQVEPMDIPRFTRLLAKNLGPDPITWNDWFVAQIARPDDPDGRLIRLAPSSSFTNNSRYFETGPALAWPPDGDAP